MSLSLGDDIQRATQTGGPRASTSDVHVRSISPLPSPREILEEMPLGDERASLVASSRDEVRAILDGTDDRLVVVTGPCSVHDTEAALDYAQRLAPIAHAHRDELRIVMRMYFEKPRTTVGWKGLINDPGMDESYDIPRGLRLARSVLLGVLDTGLPVGCEFLEPTSPQYIADTVTWGAIGARTTESQVHRQLASGVSMPIGFKNATDGTVQVAIDGCRAAGSAQVFFGSDVDGKAALVSTTGNPDTHVILRGGRGGPNYSEADIEAAAALLAKAGLPASVMVDASHANSGKSHIRQAEVAREIAAMVASGNRGISGVMLESFLVAGRQEPGPGTLVYGQSVTDACMDLATTESLLDELAAAVISRRKQ
ncbi:3-deoxy-7-phosphoheptulonate synthase [Hoyosella sp. G463]|uniref:Phospho-2-dehydro-3-deoxyheptonate aldolase n=1 Tax=Lolliginicoccus lacisalsi TaxID=2742202 RepID=A0A927PMC4_9ACTN|nr:3-deoxy-7-phosphoheptulonate synthase [Lolliginicoccus lacisalsi]MBD8506226.1 3-deoxy-7-phosphoheptulonate synthase [Lolliginicoccus lacisalsi]